MNPHRNHPTRRVALMAAVLLAVLTTEARTGEHEDRLGASSLAVTRRFEAHASHATRREIEVDGKTRGGDRSAEASVEGEIGWERSQYGTMVGSPLVRFRATASARESRFGQTNNVWIELQINGADAVPLEHRGGPIAVALTVDGTFEDTRDDYAYIELRPLGLYFNQDDAVLETTSSGSIQMDLKAVVRDHLGRQTARIDGVVEASCEVDGEEDPFQDEVYDLRIVPGAVRLDCHLAARFGLAWGTADLETEGGVLSLREGFFGLSASYLHHIDPLSVQLFGVSYVSALRAASLAPVLVPADLPALPMRQLP